MSIEDKPYNDIEGCIRIGQIVKTLMQAYGSSSKTVIKLTLIDAVKMMKQLEERIK